LSLSPKRALHTNKEASTYLVRSRTLLAGQESRPLRTLAGSVSPTAALPPSPAQPSLASTQCAKIHSRPASHPPVASLEMCGRLGASPLLSPRARPPRPVGRSIGGRPDRGGAQLSSFAGASPMRPCAMRRHAGTEYMCVCVCVHVCTSSSSPSLSGRRVIGWPNRHNQAGWQADADVERGGAWGGRGGGYGIFGWTPKLGRGALRHMVADLAIAGRADTDEMGGSSSLFFPACSPRPNELAVPQTSASPTVTIRRELACSPSA
jgi:hypothetical protein